MQIISYVIGVVLLVLGGVWVLQGLNVIPGDMAGQVKWAVDGAALVVIGLLLMIWTSRRYKV